MCLNFNCHSVLVLAIFFLLIVPRMVCCDVLYGLPQIEAVCCVKIYHLLVICSVIALQLPV